MAGFVKGDVVVVPFFSQIGQFIKLYAHFVTSLFHSLLEAIQIISIAAQVRSRFASLLGIGTGAIDQFSAFQQCFCEQ